MHQRDDLFELIQSMSPSEKRYFKVHAHRQTVSDYKSQYEKLYDALKNWEGEYDEKEFKKKQKGKTFIKNLAVEKNHLYDVVLKTLRNYSSQQNPELRLHEMIITISLLINKGLKVQAYKLIERAEKLAGETEQCNEMLSLVEFLLRLYRMAPAESRYTASEIMQRSQDLLDKISVTQRAVYLRIQMVDINAQNTWTKNKSLVASIKKEAETLSAQKGLSRVAQLSLLNVKQFDLIHRHKYKEGLDLTAPWLDKIEKEKVEINYSSQQYLVTMANYMLCAFMYEKLELLPPIIAKIKRMQANDTLNENEEADCFTLSTQYDFLYMINTGDFQNATHSIRQIEAGMLKYRHIISERQIVNFQFNILLLLFLQKNYKDSLKRINHLNELCGRDERYGIYISMIRVIEWMCQLGHR